MKRVVYRVQWRDGEWAYSHDHNPNRELVWVLPHATKRELVRRARERARHVWLDHSIPTQLVIHGKNGQIQTEYTYGADPRRSKG